MIEDEGAAFYPFSLKKTIICLNSAKIDVVKMIVQVLFLVLETFERRK